jgi:uncharacterized phage protein gp47/JayE
MVTGDGRQYTNTALATIANQTPAVTSITRSGTTATLTSTGIGLLLSDNVNVTVTGAVETDYNVVGATITVASDDTITYEVSGSPSTPATGSPAVSFDVALLSVESVDFLEDADADPLAAFTLEAPLVGVEETVKANNAGLTGGLDRETDEALRVRLLDRIQNPVAHFNVADIQQLALTVAGVTRVFVLEITPAAGQVTVYFMRDLDATGAIPDGAEVTAVKTVLDTIRPANTDPEDLIVLAPTAAPADFDFDSLLPFTTSMRAAVIASLEDFFAARTTLGTPVSQDEYRSAIFNTVDTTNGDIVASFALNTPAGPIPVSSGEIATLGNVSGI